MPRDDSLSRYVAGGNRRQRRNLTTLPRATEVGAVSDVSGTDPDGDKENAPADSPTFVVPTDEAMVIDLRFTDKYPKIDSDTNSAGSDDPKTDGDGTIALSRKVFDASVHGLHHHINTIDTWGIGPSGLEQDPNPEGDWVYDWPRPVPGVAGWGLRIPDPFDYKNVAGGVATNFNPSGCVAYFGASDADVRGPNGEFNQMESFSYLMWFRPAIEADWNFYLAAVYDSAASSAFNATLGKTLVSEKAGWLWMYEFYPGSAPYEDHYISFTSNASGGVADIYYGSNDGGVCDPFFGEAADSGLHDEGLVATVPAFLALVVGPDESGSVAVQMYLGNPRTGVLHDVTTGVNYGTDVASAVPTPTAFTSADNQTQHVVGNIRQRRSSSLLHTQSDEGAHGVIDGCIRHNRALTAREVRGAFAAGLRRLWQRTTPLIETDVDNTGESASEVSAP